MIKYIKHIIAIQDYYQFY